MKSRLPRRAERKKAGPRCGGPPRELAVKSQFPARAAVMMAMEQLPLNVPFCGDPLGFKCSGRQSRPSAKVLSWGQNACTRHSAPPHRRRKVRLSPFPPDGENCARSLAPPLPTRPAAAGLGRGTPLLGPRGLFHGREAKAKRAPNGGPPRELAVNAQLPARAAVMMAME